MQHTRLHAAYKCLSCHADCGIPHEMLRAPGMPLSKASELEGHTCAGTMEKESSACHCVQHPT